MQAAALETHFCCCVFVKKTYFHRLIFWARNLSIPKIAQHPFSTQTLAALPQFYFLIKLLKANLLNISRVNANLKLWHGVCLVESRLNNHSKSPAKISKV